MGMKVNALQRVLGSGKTALTHRASESRGDEALHVACGTLLARLRRARRTGLRGGARALEPGLRDPRRRRRLGARAQELPSRAGSACAGRVHRRLHQGGFAGRRTIAFVNAVQETFTLRKSNNSASVGVSPFGSLSLPSSGSDESLVRVASTTVTDAPFYERFFQLLDRYLAGDVGQLLPMPAEVPPPAPPGAMGTSPSARVTAGRPPAAAGRAPSSPRAAGRGSR